MPQSQARVVLHVTFSTKNRVPFLKDPIIRKDLEAYVASTLQERECEPITIRSVEDHIHILSNMSRMITIANFIEAIKSGPSRWIKKQGRTYEDFYWQRGYGAFSVSQSSVQRTREYVDNQEEHHRTMSFQEEFRILCRKHGLKIDERYAWD